MTTAMLWGEFRGKVVTEWLDSAHEDRRMRIHPDTSLIFVRCNDEVIAATIGMEFDGASIPPGSCSGRRSRGNTGRLQ